MRSREPAVTLKRIENISLRVRDVEASARFYASVFGLESGVIECSAPRRCVCRNAGNRDFAIAMTEGGPILSGAGMDHFSLEVDSVEHVDLIRERARRAGGRTIAPRQSGARWEAYVFDLDGHKIRVFTRRSTREPAHHAVDQRRPLIAHSA